MEEQCPCLSGQPYSHCCQPLHAGTRQAATADQLMRSRYSAFVKHSVDYLIRTLHPSKRAAEDHEQLQFSFKDTQWLGLTILNRIDGQAHDNAGMVEFIARYQHSGNPGQLRECSRFIKEDGVWFYLDGTMPPQKQPARNEPCWCGSGKKFKKCHGFQHREL